MRLFGRSVAVHLGQEGEDGRSYTGLRVTFDIRHTNDLKPSTGRISIYNVSDATIEAMRGPRGQVSLFAGYVTQGAPRLIFRGNPTENGVTWSRDGADRVLTIDAKDGGRAYRDARVDVCFGRSVKLSEVYAEVQRKMGLPVGRIDLARDIEFPQGLTLNGTARDVLARVAVMSDAQVWVRDGVLQIAEGGDTGESGPLLATRTGTLIGAPTCRDKGQVEATCHLDASLRPGRRFRVEHRDLTGNFVATAVQFRGDNFGPQFVAVATGRPL